MSKRFTDFNKWDDPFFTGLPNDLKLIWLYMLDKCDHAGIFKVNFDLMKYQCNCKKTPEQIYNAFKDRIITINNEKWFIKKFVKFQYPRGIDNDSKCIISVRNILEHNGLLDIVKEIYINGNCEEIKQLGNSYLTVQDKDKDKDKEKDKEKYLKIIEYLNNRSGKKYKVTEKHRQYILARFNEGFVFEDFKRAIDNKVEEWNNTEMEKYIRPETLFGNKMDSYINQKPVKKFKEKVMKTGKSFEQWEEENK